MWEALASLGAVDLTVARVAEPHLDALAVLREARRQGQVHDGEWSRHACDWSDTRLWQVYSAEGAERLSATEHDRGWALSGVKPRCSVAAQAGHALVTAWDGAERRLFAVSLDHPGVTPAPGTNDAGGSTWAAGGLALVRSAGLAFDAVPAVPIGGPGWYFTRPGFAWGGIGVAAIWYGATVALARRLLERSRHQVPDQVALMHLGAVDTALNQTRTSFAEAAAVADSGEVDPVEAVLTAQRVRQSVADTAEQVLTQVGHALDPVTLTGDEDHARRVADLTVYLREHDAERDLVRQGEQVLAGTPGWTW